MADDQTNASACRKKIASDMMRPESRRLLEAGRELSDIGHPQATDMIGQAFRHALEAAKKACDGQTVTMGVHYGQDETEIHLGVQKNDIPDTQPHGMWETGPNDGWNRKGEDKTPHFIPLAPLVFKKKSTLTRT